MIEFSRAGPIDTQVQPPLLVDPRTSALVGRPASRRSWSAPLSNDFARSLRTSDTIGPQPLPGSGVATPDALAGRGVVSAPDAWSFTGAGGSGVEASDAERPAPGGAPGVPPDAPADARTPPRPMDMPSEPWRGSQRTTAFGRSLEGMLQGVERRNADGTFHSRTLRASFGLWFASHGARGPDFSDPAERKAFLTEENSAALRELRSQFRAATDGMSRSEFDRAARDFKRALAAVLYRDMLNAWKQGGRKPPKPRRRDAERIAEWALNEVMQRSDENPPPPPPGGPELGAPGGGAADGGGGSGNGAGFCPCPCKSPFEHLGSNSDSLDDDIVEPGEEPGGGGGGGDIYTWIRDRYPPMQPQPPGSEVIHPPGSFRQPGDWFTVRDREHSPADVVIGPGGGTSFQDAGVAPVPGGAAPPAPVGSASTDDDGLSPDEERQLDALVDAALAELEREIKARNRRQRIHYSDSDIEAIIKGNRTAIRAALRSALMAMAVASAIQAEIRLGGHSFDKIKELDRSLKVAQSIAAINKWNALALAGGDLFLESFRKEGRDVLTAAMALDAAMMGHEGYENTSAVRNAAAQALGLIAAIRRSPQPDVKSQVKLWKEYSGSFLEGLTGGPNASAGERVAILGVSALLALATAGASTALTVGAGAARTVLTGAALGAVGGGLNAISRQLILGDGMDWSEVLGESGTGAVLGGVFAGLFGGSGTRLSAFERRLADRAAERVAARQAVGGRVVSGRPVIADTIATEGSEAGAAAAGWTRLTGRGVRIRRVGNYWIKEVDPEASRLAQWYGRGTIKAQAKGLERLRDMAPDFLYRDGKIITRHAGEFEGGIGDFLRTWAKGSWRLRTPFNDIRLRNIGEGGIIFDPSLHPLEQAALAGATGYGTYRVVDYATSDE